MGELLRFIERHPDECFAALLMVCVFFGRRS